MAGLKHTMAAMGSDSVGRYFGTTYWDGSKWWARIGDSLLDPDWLDTVQPVQGDNIVVDIITKGRGQSSALVIGSYTSQPAPPVGTVPQAAPPPKPATVRSGDTHLAPTASDTWGVGGWGRWATSQRGGQAVYTGTWSGQTVTGSWFYGAPRPELAGKTVTRVLFKVPPRLEVGASGDVVVHFYAHTSGSRPGDDVNRVSGPFDVTIPDGYAGGYTDLPTAFGSVIADGGGISIAGGSYAGFQSRLKNPSFGELIVSWSS